MFVTNIMFVASIYNNMEDIINTETIYPGLKYSLFFILEQSTAFTSSRILKTEIHTQNRG